MYSPRAPKRGVTDREEQLGREGPGPGVMDICRYEEIERDSVKDS